MPSIEVEGSRVSYLESGQGETVVLLHSSASSSTQWRSLIESLQTRFRVLAPDLYGYGGSEAWPGHKPLTLGAEAKIVEALAKTSDGPIHLVGHSYGGAVALRAALYSKIALRSLTLIEPVAFHLLWNSGETTIGSFGEVRSISDAVSGAVSSGAYHNAMRRFVDYWNGEGAWGAMSDRQRKAISGLAPKVALDFWSSITEPTLIEDYASIDTPTLLICGSESPEPTHCIIEMLDASLRSTDLQLVMRAGHMLPLTHQEQVNPLITRQIERHTGGARRAA